MTDNTPNPTAPAYLVQRRPGHDRYTLWRLDFDDPAVFVSVPLGAAARFPDGHHLCAVGGYLLSYSRAVAGDTPPNIEYRLFPFDPEAPNPLGTQAVQAGLWEQSKFLGFYDHYTWSQDYTDLVKLIPVTGYVLACLPAPSRYSFQLWNFDPAPTAPGGADPLPAHITQQDAFSLIDADSVLLPMNNRVLEWRPTERRYRVWSFDPQEDTPLALPVLTEGEWPDMDETHQLIALGDHVLDWQPANRHFRLWRFDPHAADPLTGPVTEGTLPEEFAPDSVLLGIDDRVPLDSERADRPGSMEFMRDKIEHLVVYMLESRSMDSVLGWLYEGRESDTDTITFLNAAPPYRGTSTDYTNESPDGPVHVYKFKDGALGKDFDLLAPKIDPFHGTPDSIFQQYSGGYADYFAGTTPDMGGFVHNNASKEVMVTLTPTQLPVLNGLAAAFAVSDEWFSALPGGTDSNRAVALTGSSFNITATYEGPPQYGPFPDKTRRQSLWKVLWDNGETDWKIYWAVKWFNEVFTYHLYLQGQVPTVDADVAAGGTNYVAPIDQFISDAQNGTLPKFSFLEPAWIAPSGSTSYHPGGDLVPPEQQLNRIYRAIADGPGWNKTALLITFSKGGGLYDHEPPPATVNPWPKDVNDGFRYDVLGPRVPAIVVSPWVNANTVFRSPQETPFSATSTAATVLRWLGIPSARWGLGDRVPESVSFESVFQRSEPRSDAPRFKNPYDRSYPEEDD